MAIIKCYVYWPPGGNVAIMKCYVYWPPGGNAAINYEMLCLLATGWQCGN